MFLLKKELPLRKMLETKTHDGDENKYG